MKIKDIEKILKVKCKIQKNYDKLSEGLDTELSAKTSFYFEKPENEITTLLTDSRNLFIPSETLFFAIRTPGGNDGHKYIRELYNKGVRNFVVEEIPEELNKLKANFLIVDDVIKSLAEIGKTHRFFSKEIVAITGSRGKTTLKEMIFQLMEPYKKISRSPRSYNSKIGVPLSLWQISPDSEISIIEAGISKKGEMQNLADTILPDTVIFTNIGDAHSNGFESKEEKAEEKFIIARGESVKTIIYPKDNKLIDTLSKSLPKNKEIIRWSLTDSDVELFINIKSSDKINSSFKKEFENNSPDILSQDQNCKNPNSKNVEIEYIWKEEKGKFKAILEKDYDLENIAGALAFMLKEGLNQDQIERSFKNLKRINTRLNVSDGINGCSVILDSYTSDLSSLLPAIDFMNRRKMPWQTSTLIISDLHYEGHNIADTYKEMSDIVKKTGITKVIGVGESLIKYSNLFPNGSKFFSNTSSLLETLSLSDFNDEIILLKGGGEYDFEKIHEQLEAKKHETVLEVNLDAILRNYNYFKSHVPSSTGMIAMVKAQGYGAGSYEIAKTLQDAGASYLAVAALDEGIDLRNNGIIMPIMIMNPRAANYRALFKNRLEPVIYTVSMLQKLADEAGKYGEGEYPVHIKLDTGMHRMGFEEKEIDKLLELMTHVSNIRIATIFSHLATADCLDMDQYTQLQFKRFERMSHKIINAMGYPIKRHILNSAGILRFPEYHYDFVRLGIGLYGANTLPKEIEKPLYTVSTLRTVVISVREIEGDEAVGYSRKGKIKGRTKVATIPIGYADGMNRKFGNGALKVLVNGQKVPTIGNICMDASMLDVSDIDCKEGDAVEIFGENISVQTLADTLGTIPYEILTSISPRVKRVYFRE